MNRNTIAVLAAVIAFSACTKVNYPSPDNITVQEEGAKSVVFAATAEAVDEDPSQTRATFDNTRRCASWEAGDMAVINGLSFESTNSGIIASFRRNFGDDSEPTKEVRPTFVSSQSGGFDGQGASMLVDDEGVNTKWHADRRHYTNDYVWDIVVSLDKPSILKAFKLWNADDAETYYKRIWMDFKIFGSESKNGEWTELQSYSSPSHQSTNKALCCCLDVNSPKAYRFYKLEIKRAYMDDGIQMSDMKFIVNDKFPEIYPPYTAYYPDAIYKNGVLTLPSAYNETWEEGKFDMPMYAVSDNTDLRFKNLCGVLKVVVRNDQITSVKRIHVSSANRALSGTFTVMNDAAVLDSPSTVRNSVAVNYPTPVQTSAEGTAFYIPIPAQTYSRLKITVYDETGTYTMTTKSGLNVNVERSSVYTVNFIKNQSTVSGALNGRFTVNASGKMVRFAQGNLTYNVITKKWAFYEHQYDRASGYDANLISLHNWGYVPNHSIYPGSWYENYSGWKGDLPANADFGWVFGGEASPWQNLTAAEWNYLLNSRIVAGTGDRYLLATINSDVDNGVYGLILYPDNYTAQTDAISYTSSQWSAMETAGCVFLPAAGSRYKTDVSSVGEKITYWTASSSLTGSTDYALVMTKYGNTAPHTTSIGRFYSCAVRLATEE